VCTYYSSTYGVFGAIAFGPGNGATNTRPRTRRPGPCPEITTVAGEGRLSCITVGKDSRKIPRFGASSVSEEAVRCPLCHRKWRLPRVLFHTGTRRRWNMPPTNGARNTIRVPIPVPTPPVLALFFAARLVLVFVWKTSTNCLTCPTRYLLPLNALSSNMTCPVWLLNSHHQNMYIIITLCDVRNDDTLSIMKRMQMNVGISWVLNVFRELSINSKGIHQNCEAQI